MAEPVVTLEDVKKADIRVTDTHPLKGEGSEEEHNIARAQFVHFQVLHVMQLMEKCPSQHQPLGATTIRCVSNAALRVFTNPDGAVEDIDEEYAEVFELYRQYTDTHARTCEDVDIVKALIFLAPPYPEVCVHYKLRWVQRYEELTGEPYSELL